MVKQTVFNTIHTIPINGIKHVLCKHARNVLSCTRATDVQAVLSLVVWVATPPAPMSSWFLFYSFNKFL